MKTKQMNGTAIIFRLLENNILNKEISCSVYYSITGMYVHNVESFVAPSAF